MMRGVAVVLLMFGCWTGCSPETRATRVLVRPDGAALDGAAQTTTDAATGDGAVTRDGGQVTVEDDGGDASAQACLDESSDVWSRNLVAVGPLGFALCSGTQGIALVYADRDGCSELHAEATTSTGPLLEEAPVVQTSASCATHTALAVGPLETGFILAWVDNSAGSAELFAQRFDETFAAESGVLRVTENDALESLPALATVNAHLLLAYAERAEDQTSIRARVIDRVAETATVVAADAGQTPSQLALSAIDDDRAVLAFVDEGDLSGIWLVTVDGSGSALSSPQQIQSQVGADPSIAVARQGKFLAEPAGGGALVYTLTNTQQDGLHFVQLGADGLPTGNARQLISAPLLAQAVAIASLGEGYAVAYRALPDGDIITEPEIRLLFVDANGSTARDLSGRALSYRLATTTEDSGGLNLHSTVDGQLVVSWTEHNAGSGTRDLHVGFQPLDCQAL